MPQSMEVGLGPGGIVLDGDPVLPPQKKRHTPKFSAHVYCGQTLRCIRIPLHKEVGLTLGDTVLDGDPAAPYKGAQSPLLGPCLLWPNCGMDQDATEYGGMPRPRRHCVRLGPSSSPSKKGHTPKFSAHVCCDQMLRCIRIPLRTEVLSLGADDSVLDRYPPKKGWHSPNVWPMSIVAKRLDGSRCHFVRR